MRIRSVASRLAWSFAAVFFGGMLLIAAFAYFELVIEPRYKNEKRESVMQGVIEVAVEATISVALLSLGGWWLARRALRPAEVLADAADRIHEGNLHEVIVMSGSGAEFERLASVFNAMTARLDASFQRVRQFTLYASHELKTPLAILRAELERMMDDPRRRTADQASVSRQLDEIDRLTHIVDGLTFLTKADANLIPLSSETVALRPLVISSVEDTSALAAEHHVEVTLGRCDEAMIQADRHRLRQLLVILCDNAVKYNRPGGTIHISLTCEDSGAILRISNTGAGIPAEEQGRVFERFYRGSGVGSRRIEGTGLGLSIAQWIVHESKGTLRFSSAPDQTEFVAGFTAAAAPSPGQAQFPHCTGAPAAGVAAQKITSCSPAAHPRLPETNAGRNGA